ncbi:hypothetical protein L7F22_052953 [Adiantum nelumboides]|nr:hypothetical protein [Adiantum nelumboides]
MTESNKDKEEEVQDDPLRRQRTPSPLPFATQSEEIERNGGGLSEGASSSRQSHLSQTNSPQRLPKLKSAEPLSSSDHLNSQPLIRLNDEDTQSKEANRYLIDDSLPSPNRIKYPTGGLESLQEEPSTIKGERMSAERSYGALETSDNAAGNSGTRHHLARQSALASSEPVSNDIDEAPFNSGGPRKQRQFSFKKRKQFGGGSVTGSESPSQGGGGGNGFLKRASMAAFGRALPSNASNAPSGDGIRSASQMARNRNLRRIHTISVNGHQNLHGNETDMSQWERKPRIPSLMPAKSSPNSTPIPTVPFVVLCLVCFGEFSSAGVAGPFLFFQIESFNVGGEGEVGYWAGVVASVFFFAQFLTSLLWASIAQKHGRRAVLLVSLVGNSISLILFGMATNLRMAISVRLAQGLFNGAVGVAKGAVRDLTDETNEGRAMAQLGFAWGMGGIVGPLMGGLLCNPTDKFPWLFGNNEFLKQYPYVLPCLIVASFTAIGAFLTLFIGPDGGPRTGAIQLPEKPDVERAGHRNASNLESFGRSASKKISGYFKSGQDGSHTPTTPLGESLVSLRGAAMAGPSYSNEGLPRTFTQQVEDETGGPPSPHDSDDEGTIITTTRAGTSGFDDHHRPAFARNRPRPMSRTTARHRSILGGGSAYGYEGNPPPSSYTGAGGGSRFGAIAPSQLDVSANASVDNRRNSTQHNSTGMMNNRASILSTTQYAPDFEQLGNEGPDGKPRQLSFAQRFFLANDDAVLGLSDLWVAAAINNDETYLDDEDDDFGYDYGDEEDDTINRERLEEEETEELDDSLIDEGSDFDRSLAHESTGSMAFGHDETDEDSPLMPRHLPPLNFARRHRLNSTGASSRDSRPFMTRRGSNSNRIPSVYSNTGVESAQIVLQRPMSPNIHFAEEANGSGIQGAGATTGYDPTLAGIPESASVSGTMRVDKNGAKHAQYGGGDRSQISLAATSIQRQRAIEAQRQSLLRQLPLSFIAHYALLSLHSSTFDQVFMAYLVTPFKSGGLGLTAAHYAELIAALAFFQIGSQFYFYPKVGPPQGKLSHLSMMRLGTSLYLPVYVLFAYLRAFLHPSTDAIVMSFMILFASLRLLANTCSFTAVSILMNATTQPHLVPLANGLAQTTSSAARFVGPLVGGMLWAKGVEGGYETHTWPFNYHLGFWVAGLLGFAGFLHSWLIR